jgi:8-amino-7-oxononanoate synthase
MVGEPCSALCLFDGAARCVRNEPQRRLALLDQAAKCRGRLEAQGWRVGASASQIIPLLVGEPARAVALSGALIRQGLFVPAIRPPTVPEGQSLLRISLSWAHTPAMIERLVEALAAEAGEVR